jgi:hypothetical protein
MTLLSSTHWECFAIVPSKILSIFLKRISGHHSWSVNEEALKIIFGIESKNFRGYVYCCLLEQHLFCNSPVRALRFSRENCRFADGSLADGMILYGILFRSCLLKLAKVSYRFPFITAKK